VDAEVSVQREGREERGIKESEESEIRDLSCGESKGQVPGESWGKQINVLNKQSEKSELVIDVGS